jgi:hypothetical protein
MVIVGAMRAGTTSLFSFLARHPQVAASFGKEVHYFDLRFHRGPAWYRCQFRRPRTDTRGDAVGVESSPYYMFDPRVPGRMAALMPDVKLVFLLRDPVERAFSHYRKNCRDGREPLSFADALAAEMLAELLTFAGLEPWAPRQFNPLNAGQNLMPFDPRVDSRLAATFIPHERQLADLIGWCPSRTGRDTASTRAEAA